MSFTECQTFNVKRFLVLVLCAVSCCLAGCQRVCTDGCSSRLPLFPRINLFGKKAEPIIVDPRKYSLYVSPHLHQLMPKRVLIVPTGTESGQFHSPALFADAMAGAMRAAGIAEIVFPPQINCQMSVDNILSGQFDEHDIIELSRAWHCDAVLFVRVNQLRAFAPLSASVTAALVDATESVVIFAIDGNWDVADPDIKPSYERFVKLSSIECSDAELRLLTQSPNRLFAYIAWQMTTALQQASY
ncbi:MAG TPA: hypothetical protein PKD64_01780 [Pirellulaceae bacterium]|nr:hypothetical protein [Pirellulaceae bacterium]HMO90900.1 hypothetical protein [Pirellulaceae bacterium]HMP68624.1 hypothetical protein [Pirellulaceae bacterium]